MIVLINSTPRLLSASKRNQDQKRMLVDYPQVFQHAQGR